MLRPVTQSRASPIRLKPWGVVIPARNRVPLGAGWFAQSSTGVATTGKQ